MKVCRKCGAQMDDDKFFCTYCGSKLSNNVNGKNGNSKWLIIIPIIIVVLFLMLAVVGGGCWFFWKYYNNRTSDYDEYDLDTITEMVDSVAISEDDSDNPYEEIEILTYEGVDNGHEWTQKICIPIANEKNE